jgi:hypothetical protein
VRLPKTTIDSGPGAVSNSPDADFEFSADENNAEFECRVDAGDWEACESPTSVTDLESGDHTFDVRATDEAGNTGTAATRDWEVDLENPSVEITSGPEGTTHDRSASFEFTSNEEGATFECSPDGGAFTTCTGPVTWPELPTGDHEFQVRAVDRAGNTGAAASRPWTIRDSAAPSLSITGRAKLSRRGKANVGTASCSEPAGCLVTTNHAQLRVGGKKFDASFLVPGTIRDGQTATVQIAITGAALKALKKKGKGKLTGVVLTLYADGGATTSHTQKIKLKI